MTLTDQQLHDFAYQCTQFTDEAAIEKAERLGCTIEYSDDLTLQLDLDGDQAYDVWVRQIDMLEDLGIVEFATGADAEVIRRSRSGKNYHVTLKLAKPLPVETRILLQALLGSDIKREMLAFAGVLKGTQKNPVLLFRPKTYQHILPEGDEPTDHCEGGCACMPIVDEQARTVTHQLLSTPVADGNAG